MVSLDRSIDSKLIFNKIPIDLSFGIETVYKNKQASKIYSATFVEKQLQTTSKDKYLANKKEKELLLRER